MSMKLSQGFDVSMSFKSLTEGLYTPTIIYLNIGILYANWNYPEVSVKLFPTNIIIMRNVMENSLESISQCGRILGIAIRKKTTENDLNNELHHGLTRQH